MKKIIKKNHYFLFPYFIFIIIAALILCVLTKKEIHIVGNQYHNEFFDCFFKYFTYLGDGVFAAILIAIMLFISYRYFFILLTAILSSSLVTFLIKRVLINPNPRPLKYFEGIYNLYLVDGVNVHRHYSFPSGHTCTGFIIFLFLSLLIKHKILKFIFFIIALLIGLSRVYLSQHFFIDIVAGSLIGTLLTLLSYYWFSRKNNLFLDKSIIGKATN